MNGQHELFENKICIRRKGLTAVLSQGLKGDKEIFINQISSIQIKKAGLLTNGFIQFAFMGGLEAKDGLLQSTSDENSLIFTKKHQESFEQIKEAIERKFFSKNNNVLPNNDINDLEKLSGLHTKGIITDDEFNAKKKQILGL
jgi:hypothetical protein